MGSSVLDFEAIQRPVPGKARAGANLRGKADSAYYSVKEKRTAARDAERKAETDAEKQQGYFVAAEWREVRSLALRTLQDSSKDIDLVAWLIEALCRLEGFAGLRDGFRLARGLVEEFWDELWPRPDEDGALGRLVQIIALNGEDSAGTLITPIARIPITNGGASFATWHYQRAALRTGTPLPASAAAVTLTSVQRAADETPTEFLRERVTEIEQAQSEVDALFVVLDQKCGGKGPSSANIRGALEGVLEALRGLAGARLGLGPAEDPVPVESTAKPVPGHLAERTIELTPVAREAAPSGVLRSREDAFLSLQRVAEYFRTTEPHSPLSYVLEQAVRWGRLPLPALLPELIPDETARDKFMKLTGIRAPEK